MKPQAAVLTGDLIGSTEAPPEAVDQTMTLLADLARRIGAWTRFTRYRGDGWQIYLENPGSALSTVLFMWASLRMSRTIESRIAVGLGLAPVRLERNALAAGAAIKTGQPHPLNALAPFGLQDIARSPFNALAVSDLSGEMGTAFTASGRALDGMGRNQYIALAGQGVDPLHQRLFALIDDRINDWSVEQAEVMALAFAPEGKMTQNTMAECLGISRQAVAARLQSGGFLQLYGAALDFDLTFGRGSPT